MKTAVDIYKLLPKTNCGKCGTGTCFGFAVKLATSQASPDACPNMTAASRASLEEAAGEKRDSRGSVWDQALQSLKPRIQRTIPL